MAIGLWDDTGVSWESATYRDLNMPKTIRFGENSFNSINNEIKKKNPSKIIIVSDEGLEKSGILKYVTNKINLGSSKIATFTEIKGEPTFLNLKSAIDFINKENGDFVIGIGGGSALDVAKASASIAGKSNIEKYLSGEREVESRDITLILIPTTSGTGSEVTMNAIFEDTEQKVKRGILSPLFLPDVAIVDPVLTISCPPSVTASSGVDAFTHALESYISNKATPITRMYAEKAMRIFPGNITQAVFNGSQIGPRREMSLVSLLAGVSLANAGVGAVHALAYPLGAKYHIQHGVANALLMPYVFEVIGKACASDMVNVANFLQLGNYEKRRQEAPNAVVKYLFNLLSDLNLPTSLAELNVEESDLKTLANQASQIARLLDNTPYKLNEQTIFEIYQSAFKGFQED